METGRQKAESRERRTKSREQESGGQKSRAWKDIERETYIKKSQDLQPKKAGRQRAKSLVEPKERGDSLTQAETREPVSAATEQEVVDPKLLMNPSTNSRMSLKSSLSCMHKAVESARLLRADRGDEILGKSMSASFPLDARLTTRTNVCHSLSSQIEAIYAIHHPSGADSTSHLLPWHDRPQVSVVQVIPREAPHPSGRTQNP